MKEIDCKDPKTSPFAENLQFLRAQHGMSQEALAEQCGVSRQSVSKWESGLAYPEMTSLLTLCDLFSMDLDTLLRGKAQTIVTANTDGYDRLMNRNALSISVGVGIILFGCGLCQLWSILWEQLHWASWLETMGAALLLLCILAAVTLFVVAGLQEDQFRKKHPVLESLYTDAQRDAFAARSVWLIAGPIAAILADVILLIAFVPLLEQFDWAIGVLIALFLWIMGGAVSVLVWVGLQQDKFNLTKYNLQNTPAYRRKEELTGLFCGCIMLVTTAVYLGVCLPQSRGWRQMAWLFAVGGIFCAIAALGVDYLYRRQIRAEEQPDLWED